MAHDSGVTKTGWTKAELARQKDDPHYRNATGGWGSMKSLGGMFRRERPTPAIVQTLARQNKTHDHGHMCTSCAWGKPAEPRPFEFCENGAKATIWELTSDRCTPDFFALHSLSELKDWADHDLEMAGR